jgi:hypothetical protein
MLHEKRNVRNCTNFPFSVAGRLDKTGSPLAFESSQPIGKSFTVEGSDNSNGKI